MYLVPPQARRALARRGRPGGPFGMLLTANLVVNGDGSLRRHFSQVDLLDLQCIYLRILHGIPPSD
jgi:hypothetical protein